jgi:CheY-like chemotaxis protein
MEISRQDCGSSTGRARRICHRANLPRPQLPRCAHLPRRENLDPATSLGTLLRTGLALLPLVSPTVSGPLNDLAGGGGIVAAPHPPRLALPTQGGGKPREIRRITGARRKRTILVIDDDDDMRALMADHFDRLGYRVFTACDGNDGIARALEMHPDAILLDLVMPRLDGWNTARLLRAYPSTAAIPLVAWTGSDGTGQRGARAAGCDAVVMKSSPTEVLDRVINLMFQGGGPGQSDAG